MELVRKIEGGRHRRRVRAVEGAGQNASRERRFRRLGAIRLLMERLTGLSPAPHAVANEVAELHRLFTNILDLNRLDPSPR